MIEFDDATLLTSQRNVVLDALTLAGLEPRS